MLNIISAINFLATPDTNACLIDDLLPEGLALLAAPAKSGQTSLLLNLALSLTRGESALGHFASRTAGVLYLNLQTPAPLLRSHVRRILGSNPMPQNLHICELYETQLADIRRGDLSCLQTNLQGPLGIRLIIIEDLEALFQTKAGSRPDFAIMASLRTLALKYHATILLSHQLKREVGRNPFASLSTSGLLKAVDTALVLNRPHEENLATLHISSNWLPDHSFCLSMSEHFQWHYAPDAIAPTPTHKLTSSNNQKVLAALKSANAICTSKHIAAATGIPNNSVRTCFADLFQEKLILREKEGRYYHPDADLTTTTQQQHNALYKSFEADGIAPTDYEFIAGLIERGTQADMIEDLLRTRHHDENYIYPPAQRERDSQVAQHDHPTQQHNATTTQHTTPDNPPTTRFKDSLGRLLPWSGSEQHGQHNNNNGLA